MYMTIIQQNHGNLPQDNWKAGSIPPAHFFPFLEANASQTLLQADSYRFCIATHSFPEANDTPSITAIISCPHQFVRKRETPSLELDFALAACASDSGAARGPSLSISAVFEPGNRSGVRPNLSRLGSQAGATVGTMAPNLSFFQSKAELLGRQVLPGCVTHLHPP